MVLAIRQSVSPARETIYWPGSGPPRGGVVCLHGSEGGWAGWNDLCCALFAAHGFAALARNYSPRGTGLVTRPDIDDVPLEGTAAALDALRAELAPHDCGVGLFGISRGAEHALLVAQLLAEDGCPVPDAVALHSPPDATWPAFMVLARASRANAARNAAGNRVVSPSRVHCAGHGRRGVESRDGAAPGRTVARRAGLPKRTFSRVRATFSALWPGTASGN